MRLLRRPEIRVHADVDLVPPAPKPTTPSLPQCLRLRNLLESENPPVEFASRVLTPTRGGDLNVTKGEVNRVHDPRLSDNRPHLAEKRTSSRERSASSVHRAVETVKRVHCTASCFFGDARRSQAMSCMV